MQLFCSICRMLLAGHAGNLHSLAMPKFDPSKYDPALAAALERVGGPAALARALGINASAVTQWRRLPPGRAFEVAQLAGMDVSDFLRPASVG